MCMHSSGNQPVDNEYLQHFSDKISEEIEKYAIEEVLWFSRYIFTRREKKQQYGYCTHCKKEFKTDGFKHNDKVVCPKCISTCIVKASGLGRKTLIDDAYITYYEKSVINPQIIVARGIYIQRDYTGDYYKVENKYTVKALYIFEIGKSIMLECQYYRQDYFYRRDNVISLFNSWEHSNVKKVGYSIESIKQAVMGTQFQYSTWEKYHRDDMVRFFDLYSRYPGIEHLTKLGFRKIVEAKLYEYHTYNSIHWRGKNIFKMLRLNKKELRDIRASKVSIDPLVLRLYQISQKDKSYLSLEEIKNISESYGLYFKDLQSVLKYTTLKKVDAYIKKQRKNQSMHFYTLSSVLTSWKDYIADCIRLNIDLMKNNVLFPKNLYEAHQNTIKQVKLKADEELNKKIIQRAKISNEKYYFKYQNMIMRAAESTEELINEGKILSHCVGTYADRYASGETTILLIRKKDDLENPFYTVEVKNDWVIQVRGKKNCEATDEVKNFMELFKAEKLSKKVNRKMKRSA